MGESRDHKECKQRAVNQVKRSHNCIKELPLFRQGDIHFVDVAAFPFDSDSNLKPFALECESQMKSAQAKSNWEDLLEFKKRYPEAEIFQIPNNGQIDFRKLIKPVVKKKQPIKQFRGMNLGF